jgi:mono/diheme cytochrome c family protein
MRPRYLAALAATVIAVAILVLLAATGFGGFSTRVQPTGAERVAARLARRWAIPGQARAARNPVPFSPEAWSDARAHFADHCASCHANDGSGNTEVGRNLYPKAPDMRLADTQNLGDGELYWIIENGVRLTGMPAWGTGRDDDDDTWKLVHFIRRLKDLTPEHLSDMAAMNPKTPAERKEEEDDRRFLAGEDVPSPPDVPSHHQHKE